MTFWRMVEIWLAGRVADVLLFLVIAVFVLACTGIGMVWDAVKRRRRDEGA